MRSALQAVLALGLSAAAFAASPASAALYELTATGTLSTNPNFAAQYDHGFFGLPDGALDGQHFVVNMRVETTPQSGATVYSNSFSSEVDATDLSNLPVLSASITINGHTMDCATLDVCAPPDFTQSFDQISSLQDALGQVYQMNTIENPDPDNFSSSGLLIALFEHNPLNPPQSYGDLSSGVSGIGGFYFYGDLIFGQHEAGARDYDLLGDTFTVTSVPEPAAWTLLVAGFGLTGGLLRRRRAAMALHA